MRVAGGLMKGRVLRSIRGTGVRPTSAKVREAIFDFLGGRVEGARFGDFFAGVGAVGIEALSRGATHVVFVERDPRSLQVIRRNLLSCGLMDRATILPRDARAVLRDATLRKRGNRSSEPFGIVFADPPYKGSTALDFLRLMQDSELLGRDGLLIIEHDRRQLLPDRSGALGRLKMYRYGDTMVSVYTPDRPNQQGQA